MVSQKFFHVYKVGVLILCDCQVEDWQIESLLHRRWTSSAEVTVLTLYVGLQMALTKGNAAHRSLYGSGVGPSGVSRSVLLHLLHIVLILLVRVSPGIEVFIAVVGPLSSNNVSSVLLASPIDPFITPALVVGLVHSTAGSAPWCGSFIEFGSSGVTWDCILSPQGRVVNTRLLSAGGLSASQAIGVTFQFLLLASLALQVYSLLQSGCQQWPGNTGAWGVKVFSAEAPVGSRSQTARSCSTGLVSWITSERAVHAFVHLDSSGSSVGTDTIAVTLLGMMLFAVLAVSGGSARSTFSVRWLGAGSGSTSQNRAASSSDVLIYLSKWR